MTEVFIIQNQHEQFLNKGGEWVDRSEKASVFRTVHKDEAINLKVEHSVRNPDLRLAIVSCAVDQKGQVLLPEASNDHSAPNVDPREADLFSVVNENTNNHSHPEPIATPLEESDTDEETGAQSTLI